MDSIERLTEAFSKFPGIGPRQAKRFTYFILRQNREFIESLVRDMKDARGNVKQCIESFAYFYSTDPKETLSPIARDKSRDASLLLVIEKDADLENIERTGTYKGYYFVLGGTKPLIEKKKFGSIRDKELLSQVSKKMKEGLKEVVLALSATPDGEHTSLYLKETLSPLANQGLKVTLLGRGLSTGTELEYSDKETLSHALRNRA